MSDTEGRAALADCLHTKTLGRTNLHTTTHTRPQDDTWFVGRIVSDTEGGAPSAASLMLEGDAATSGGARAPLDLSLLPAARLFPGQVRALLPSAWPRC